jgi:hypothetical protein
MFLLFHQLLYGTMTLLLFFISNSNTTSFCRFVDKRTIYRLGIISLARAPVHVTDFPVINVHVDELSSARIWQPILCATLSANININYRLPIKVCIWMDCGYLTQASTTYHGYPFIGERNRSTCTCRNP